MASLTIGFLPHLARGLSALSSLRKEVEEHPLDVLPRIKLGGALLDHRQPTEAIEALMTVHAMMSADQTPPSEEGQAQLAALVQYCMGRAHIDIGDYDTARKELIAAVELDSAAVGKSARKLLAKIDRLAS